MSDIQQKRRATPSLPVTVSVVVLALLWFAMLTVGTGDADDDILRALYVGGHPMLVAIARDITIIGNWWIGIPVVAVGMALLVALGRARHAAIAFLVIGTGRVLVEAQKYSIARLRPEDEAHLVPVSSPSFPSGHAANSMIVCLTLAIVFFSHTRFRHAAIAFALLLSLAIGLSRVMLGVHWPTDVIGGWSFGLLWVALALPLAERLFPNYPDAGTGGGAQ